VPYSHAGRLRRKYRGFVADRAGWACRGVIFSFTLGMNSTCRADPSGKQEFGRRRAPGSADAGAARALGVAGRTFGVHGGRNGGVGLPRTPSR
jgi:hypothetical protein